MTDVSTINPAAAPSSAGKSETSPGDSATIPADPAAFAALIANFLGAAPVPVPAAPAANGGADCPPTDARLPGLPGAMAAITPRSFTRFGGGTAAQPAAPTTHEISVGVPAPLGPPVDAAVASAVPDDAASGADDAQIAAFAKAFGHEQNRDQTSDQNSLLAPTVAVPSDTLSPVTSDSSIAGRPDSTAPPLLDARATARAPTLEIDAKLPLHSPRFGEGFAQQVTVLVEHGIQHARLSLNPVDLGPIDVRISIQHDEATVQLASQHGGVREAINDALPRLREMLEQAGMHLADSGVFTQLPQRDQSAPGGGSARDLFDSTPRARALVEPLATHPLAQNIKLHLVDAYV